MSPRLLSALSIISVLLFASAAQADLRVSFEESAPKDRFRIENTGKCTLAGSSVLIDLSTSKGGLIFDVTDKGAGVEVFQPFEAVEGKDALAGTPTVLDGQSQIRLEVARLQPNEAIAFTIDVDDTLGQRATMVSDAEIEGATISYMGEQGETSAAFAASSIAELPLSSC